MKFRRIQSRCPLCEHGLSGMTDQSKFLKCLDCYVLWEVEEHYIKRIASRSDVPKEGHWMMGYTNEV